MNISVFTHNFHGFHNCNDYLANHLNDFCIGCIHEHWLYKLMLHKLNNVCSYYRFITTSSMNANKVCNFGAISIGIS